MIFGDGISQAYTARSEKFDIAERLKDLDDAKLQGIADNSRFPWYGRVLSHFSGRTILRERIVAGDILDFRKKGREQGHTDEEISNVYGTLLVAGKFY